MAAAAPAVGVGDGEAPYLDALAPCLEGACAGRLVAVGASSLAAEPWAGALRLVDVGARAVAQSLPLSCGVPALRWACGGALLVSGLDDGRVLCWRLNADAARLEPTAPPPEPRPPSGKPRRGGAPATASPAATAKTAPLAEPALIVHHDEVRRRVAARAAAARYVDDYAAVHLLFHEDAVSGLAASQTEPRVLLSCSWDEQVALWDVEAPRAPLASWAPPGLGRLHGVAWLAGAKAFLVGAQVDAACVFDSSLGAARPQLTLATTTAVTCVATAPGVAHLVACGTSVGDTLLFDLRSVREPLARVAPAEYGAVNELAFHATLPLLLVASDDGRVRALHVAPHSQAAAAAPRAALLHARPAASKAVCWGAERLLALSVGWDGQLATHRVTESDAL